MLDPTTPPIPQQQMPQMPPQPLQQAPVQAVPAHPQQSTNITKPTSKVSMKGIIIGCGILFMFVIGGLSLVGYNLISNPTQLSSVGLDPNTTKTLLQTFSVIFFGVLVFLGIGLLVANLYRLITVKNKSKIGYGFGAFLGFLVFIFAIVLGARVVTMINNFSVENVLDSDKLIMPYIQFKDGPKYIRGDATLKLIAPATMFYTLNNTYFNSQIVPPLGQVNFVTMFLDCGNGQKLKLNLTTAQFDGSCIYFKKGEYSLNLETTYINLPTSERMQKTFSGGSIIFDSEISIVPTKNTLTFNDANTEMIVGKTPSKVMFDASPVFRDLGLTDYKVVWDFDGDGTADKQNISSTTYVYNEAKLYNVSVRFPSLNNYIYTFPLRVEQSDVPVCEILVTKGDGKNYDIATNFFDKTVQISSYQFDIIDRKNKDKVIDTIRNTTGGFNYQFQTAGTYAVQTTFLTQDDKQGQCESDDIQIGVSDFQVNYDLYSKSLQSPQFQKITDTGTVSFVDGKIVLTEIPIVLKIQVNQINPNPATATKRVLLDGKQLVSADPNSFEFTIDDNKNHEAILIIEDKASGAQTEIMIPIIVNRADLIGKIIVTPGLVGIDPFTVTFDASTSVLNDTSDEIVYFTWNFGDGTPIQKNFSEAIITHTYRYSISGDKGEFTPIVTIKTKKGREVSVSPATNIIVKRSTQILQINIDSHPAQVANMGDKVNFSLPNLSGLPSEISWDFGNGNTQVCKTRQECGSVSQVYIQAGNYQIRTSVSYANKPTIEGTINIKVK